MLSHIHTPCSQPSSFPGMRITRPDRVGVVRLLRLGGSLKREGDGFVLDLTAMKLHKTSRFHGPSITTISNLLNEQLTTLCRDLTFDDVAESGQPYLWHTSKDVSRPVSSSTFTTLVKDAFARYSPGKKPTPPKVLRASEYILPPPLPLPPIHTYPFPIQASSLGSGRARMLPKF